MRCDCLLVCSLPWYTNRFRRGFDQTPKALAYNKPTPRIPHQPLCQTLPQVFTAGVPDFSCGNSRRGFAVVGVKGIEVAAKLTRVGGVLVLKIWYRTEPIWAERKVIETVQEVPHACDSSAL